MLVARDTETEVIERLLTAARDGVSGVLVVRGEAGIGKSALLECAERRADGFTILRGTGIESESELAYAALHQILRPVLHRINDLPDPQAGSLRAAFALSAETEDDRFRVSLGALSILAEAAEQAPVLCLVDDAQWLDQASLDALVFVARRLERESVALVFAARDEEARSFEPRGLPELRLSSLSEGDSRSLLTQQLGSSVASSVVDWLIESAEGNPLALVELPINLSTRQLAGEDPLAGKLPPATSVEQVYLDRVGRLPHSTQGLLLLAAAEETGARSVVEGAAQELRLEIVDLAAAESAGLVRVDAGQIVFRHPLVRSAIYRAATFTEREGAHRALAAASAAEGSVDRAAWHKAAATVGTDDAVARELERTADRARLRGGHSAAVAALQRAAELSTNTDAKASRLVSAADAAWRGGQPERARDLLDRASPIVSEVRLRAEIDHIRGVIDLRCGSLIDAGTILMDGSEKVAAIDSDKAFEMLVDAGSVAGRSGDMARMAEIGQRIAALPRRDDEMDNTLADLLVGVGSIIEGKSAQELSRIVAAIARAKGSDDPRLISWAATGASTIGDEAAEAALLRRAVDLARTSGAVDTLVLVLETVVSSAILSGRHEIDAEAAEGLRLSREAGLPNSASSHLAALAWMAALRGRDEECRSYAAEVSRSVRTSGLANANTIGEWAVAMLDLSIGHPDATVKRLEELSGAPRGILQPFYVLMFTPDLVEACVRAGRNEQAHAAFFVLDGFARPAAPTWALAFAARCRALLAEGSAAKAEFEKALRLHAEANRPFDYARTSLLYGEYLRRSRRRTESRQHLRTAVEDFEDLGAAHWAERARAELRASGETARKRDPSTLADLTPQELQIARQVGQGLSNKEVQRSSSLAHERSSTTCAKCS